ncbi:MAG: Fic family protein [Acidimicrobiales bacterium]
MPSFARRSECSTQPSPKTSSPNTVDALHEIVAVTAIAHGEWVRIHPFVNGNGRVARLIAAHIALRYGLPVFVKLKPRPHDVAYTRAARRSMGRPPTSPATTPRLSPSSPTCSTHPPQALARLRRAPPRTSARVGRVTPIPEAARPRRPTARTPLGPAGRG